MNTVLKGDKFENECFILIKRLLDNFQLGPLPSICRIFQKKGYYSCRRQSDIIFDLSIEVWPEGAANFSLLYLIECKDYKGKVPINDLEEFEKKIQEVTGVNCKGVFITRNGFQEGSFNFARTGGMMLIEASSQLTFNIILHKANRFRQQEEEIDFILPDIIDLESDIPTKQYIHLKWMRVIENNLIKAFLFGLNAEVIEQRDIIPILSRSEIEDIVNEILADYYPHRQARENALHWPTFEQYLYDVFELEISYVPYIGLDSSNRMIQSRCIFNQRRIEILTSLQDSSRLNFIKGHEIGHYFLHNKCSISQSAYESMEDSDFRYDLDKYQINSDRGWIEWQANTFANSLIMPTPAFLKRLKHIKTSIGLSPNKNLYVDRQRCNIDDFHAITGDLATFFRTTKTSATIKLETLNLISFERSQETVGQIIRRLYPNFD
ncbi:ImmA/IrrE family metallo-endopeptidase [Spirosoma taeanense]|uniref:ImmA/IrrE family metallo-endopeptidase n=1 Tax=Spirosoma taeanense TaxID=2735870 RepID=A0A6M5YA74_9BACT|nr:restriction endonuclease [Spirosoma taeanense]QJW90266.1 ImmA/IrrE family metallo-endopeptidase [Spirosoma taeanense]